MTKKTRKKKAKTRTVSAIRADNDQTAVMRTQGYITLNEAALRMGVSYRTIHRDATEEKFKTVNVGSRIYVDFESFRSHAGVMPVGALNNPPTRSK